MDANQDNSKVSNIVGIRDDAGSYDTVEDTGMADEEADQQDPAGNDNSPDNNLTNVSHGLTTYKGSNLYVDSMFEMTEENKKLKLYIEKLEKEVGKLEADSSNELYSIQLESLEKTISQQRSEIDRLQSTLRQQSEISQKREQQLKEEFDSKIERLSKQAEQACKERDAMVMKYAVSENNVINLQRQVKQLENKLKEKGKEKEAVEGKINVVIGEKAKLSQLVSAKNTEIMGLERELQKKKDELNAQASNLRFFQNKLKLELESHKETQTKFEKLTQKLQEAKEETAQVRKDGQEMLHRYETEGRKFLQLEDAAEVTSLQNELDSWRHKHNQLTEENNQLCKKVQILETERLEYEHNLSRLRQSTDEYRQCLVDLQAVEAELESTRLLLHREQERLAGSQTEVERLRLTNSEVQQEMAKCREREAELLSFTQMLTEKNVAIQSELTGLEARTQQQDIDLTTAKRQVTNLSIEVATLKEELEQERLQRIEEKDMLSRHLKERTETAERLTKQLEDQIGENQLLKKKHSASVKELMRELQACRRRGEALETISLGQGSRTSSNTSLNTVDASEPRVPPTVEPDRQVLIEKIVKVQRSNARKQEKLEFLEEHARQLVVELQRKSRIIQSLVMKHPPGALVSESMDDNKPAISGSIRKVALAKHRGIMASVYSSKPADDTMTLELSLEINRKLQAVLEDTLLKNITLKENMETLGNEIARLAAEQAVGARA